ncbi:MAG TPA: hypothetical protein VNT20_02465 [Flavisolibacter sp.]|nr:hypothetical protein [Flavisolibacter sp.]
MKKYVFGILAIVLALSFSAFNSHTGTKKFDTYFHFKGSAVTYDQITQQGNWEVSNGADCGGSSFTCQVLTSDASDVPSLVSYLTTNYSGNHAGAENYIQLKTSSRQD